MRDVTDFINGTAVPETHAEFMALANESLRQMSIINDHLSRIWSLPAGSKTKGC